MNPSFRDRFLASPNPHEKAPKQTPGKIVTPTNARARVHLRIAHYEQKWCIPIQYMFGIMGYGKYFGLRN